MDSTFNPIHPNDFERRVYTRQNHFFKKIFKGMQKRVVAKTAKKAGKDADELNRRLEDVMNKSGINRKITNTSKGATIAAIAAATALTAGLATGAIGLGGAAAGGTATAAKGAGVLGALGTGTKKLLGKVKKGTQNIVDPEPWLGGTNKTTAGKAIEALGNIAKERAPELLKGLQEKGLQKVAEIIGNNQTSPELLPKTANQKQLESTVINGGNTPLGALDSMIKNPLVIAAIVLLIIAVVVSLVKRNG